MSSDGEYPENGIHKQGSFDKVGVKARKKGSIKKNLLRPIGRRSMESHRNKVYPSSADLNALYEMDEEFSVSTNTFDCAMSYSEEIEEMKIPDNSSSSSCLGDDLDDEESVYTYGTSVSQLTYDTISEMGSRLHLFGYEKKAHESDDYSCRIRARKLLGEEYDDESTTVTFDFDVNEMKDKTESPRETKEEDVVNRIGTKLGMTREKVMTMLLFGGYHGLNEGEFEAFMSSNDELFLKLKEFLPNDENIKLDIAAQLMKEHRSRSESEFGHESSKGANNFNYNPNALSKRISSVSEKTNLSEIDVLELISDAHKQNNQSDKAIDALSKALELQKSAPTSRTFANLITPGDSVQQETAFKIFAKLGTKLGILLEESGKLRAARNVLLEIFSKQKKFIGDSDFDLAFTHSCLASVYSKLGRDKQALLSYKKSLELFEVMENEMEHKNGTWREYALTLRQTGLLYMKMDKIEQSILSYEKELDLVLEYAPKDESLRVEIYKRLILAFKATKDYETCLKYYQLLLKYSISKENEEMKLALKREIGDIYFLAEMNLDCIKIYNQILDDLDDKEKVTVMNNLSVICCKTNEYEKALKYCLSAETICSENKKVALEDVIMTRSNLGHIYCALDMNENALQSYELALQLCMENESLGKENSSGVLYNMGILHIKMGSLKNADKCFRQFLDSQDTNTQQNPNEAKKIKITRALNNMGNIRSQLGKYEAAISFYKDSLDLKAVIYGNDSAELFGTQSNLGTAYFEIGKYNEARDILQSLLMRMEDRGANDLAKARILNKLGNISLSSKDLESAREYYNEALTLKMKCLQDKKHEEILLTRQNLALVLCQEKNFEEALNLLLELRELQSEEMGQCHPTTTKITLDVANVYFAMENLHQAESYCLRAMKALNLGNVPSEHPLLHQSRKVFRKIITKKNLRAKQESQRSLRRSRRKKRSSKSASLRSFQ